MSVHDELTGLYNYRYLHTRLTEEFKRAERYHEPLACAFIDIDQLASRTTTRGTRRSATPSSARSPRSFAQCVRDVDVVARYGGEEFLVVLPSTHFAGAVTVAERIWREVTESRFTVDGAKHHTHHASPIGVGALSVARRAHQGCAAARRRRRLQQAKRDGGNRICVFQQQGYIYTPALGPTTSLAPPARRRSEAGLGGGR